MKRRRFGGILYTNSSTKPDLILVDKNKRTCLLVDFAIPANQTVKIKEEWKAREIFGPCQNAVKAVELEGDSDTNSRVLGTVPRNQEKSSYAQLKYLEEF